MALVVHRALLVLPRSSHPASRHNLNRPLQSQECDAQTRATRFDLALTESCATFRISSSLSLSSSWHTPEAPVSYFPDLHLELQSHLVGACERSRRHLAFCGRVSGLPPKVFEFTFPPEVALGDEILAGCVVKKGTLGPYSIVWQKDGRELESGDRVLVSGQSKTSAALRIAAVRPEDVGNYTCVARNSFGSDSFTALLVVHAPPKVGELGFPSDVALGDEVIVPCVVKKGSAGPFVVEWFKGGEQLKNAAGRVTVSTPSKSSATLHIAGLRAEDVGNYTCVARNGFGSDSATAQLVVHASPKLQSTGFPSEISLGDDTAAICLVSKGSSGPFKMTWYKDGDEVRNSKRITVVVGASKAVLNIDAIRVEDIGNYTCAATNRFGTDSLTMPLLVTAPPKLGELWFPPDVALGDEVVVTCVVKKGSAGPYQITWEKDGREVAGTDLRVSLSTLSMGSVALRVASLRAEDIGNYSCTARNRFGSDSVTAPLVVHGMNLDINGVKVTLSLY
ncbi:hypothetical protein HPB49_017478 [Dermacentor silvarum]|uniref:Uncharacterized protein n=1 Tax=Dermacentor silvarum TaxID=543639 RepID=A0ACB8DQH7_DERSI|nr:hypothetical protein HPB49_017478 [Dermacentor silvarum]